MLGGDSAVTAAAADAGWAAVFDGREISSCLRLEVGACRLSGLTLKIEKSRRICVVISISGKVRATVACLAAKLMKATGGS